MKSIYCICNSMRLVRSFIALYYTAISSIDAGIADAGTGKEDVIFTLRNSFPRVAFMLFCWAVWETLYVD